MFSRGLNVVFKCVTSPPSYIIFMSSSHTPANLVGVHMAALALYSKAMGVVSLMVQPCC